MANVSMDSVEVDEVSPQELAAAITTLARARTLEDVTYTVRKAARRLVGADGVTFVLNEDDHCHYVDEDAIGPLWKGQRFPLRQCMTGWVMINRMAVVVEDIRVDPRIPQAAYAATFVRSMAAVPIRVSDPIGAIAAYWATCRKATPAEVQTLQTLAEAASVAMENVRLLSELQASHKRAEKSAAENQILFERAAHELIERERVERERKLGQEDLSLVLSAGEMGTWDWDLRSGIVQKSPNIQRLMGDDFATSSKPGSDWFVRRIVVADRAGVASAMERARTTRDLFDFEFGYDHPVMGVRRLRATGRYFFDTDGTPIRMYGVFRDTTDYHDIQLRLEESERKLRAIFEQVPVGITLTDENGKLLEANPAARKMLGDAIENAQGVLQIYRRALRAPVSADAKDGNWKPEEFSYARRDGTTGWCRVRSAPVSTDAGPGRTTLGMMEDITENRLLEAGLVQAQKMESIGRLAGGVAHDFNNALTVIMGWLGVLQPKAPLSGPSHDGLEAIRQAADHAATLTRQLLAFARRQVLEPKVVDVNKLVGGVRRLIDGLVGDDVKVSVDLSRDAIPMKVDPGQIEQVILNLAANSRDAMPKGGKITLKTSLVELLQGSVRGELNPGRYAMIEFSDTGSGISPEALPFIFEPFFTTKDPGKGTGLGLATVHGIIRQHGGNIEVQTEQGKGTTFRILIPAVESKAPTATGPTAEQAPPGGRETILLVEDEPLVRSVAAMTLKLAGYNVIEVDGPEQAIKLVSERNDKIDLLLSDVVMPEMNGVVLAERLRDARPGMRVLLSSGYSEESLDSRSIDAGRIMFLPKPYMPDTLRRKVREALDQPPCTTAGVVGISGTVAPGMFSASK
jgi:two-component system cell cycle sensor histidine kinase/response regulator CckA